MFVRRTVLATTLAVLLAATAGCGAAADGGAELDGEQARVAQAVDDLEEAAREGEERRICRQLLTAELARRAGDCNKVVATAIDESDLSVLDVEKVTIQGDRATVEISAGADGEQKETVVLVRENRDWRFAEFGGVR